MQADRRYDALMATYAITGANRGIGLEMAKQCKAAGHTVIALCRRSSDELDGLGARVETGIDVSDDGVVDVLRRRLSDTAVDVLINNAGLLRGQTLSNLDWDSMRQQFEINSLGPLRVVSALLENLASGSKVAIVTSRMGSIADNTSGGSYGYRMSKAAVNIAGVSLAHDLRDRGVAVALLHPGWVRTAMTRNTGNIDAAEAAEGLLARIAELDVETSGRFLHQSGEALPW